MKSDKKVEKNDELEHEELEKSDSKTEKETESLKQKADEFEQKYKRALADYQNLEKRVREEKSNWIRTANKELLLRLLPVLDTLMLASKHSQDQSLKISLQQFVDVLRSEGVETVKTEGKDFDPRTMECVVTEEVDPSAGSGQLDGKVLEELRAGYMLGETVLRPAQVKVGKKES